MWRRLPDNIIQERTEAFERNKGMPRIARGIFATLLFTAVLYGISHLNNSDKAGQTFNLQNASVLSLISIFIATVLFMYFLLVKNRKPPVIFICYDCQEPFHVRETCPACNSTNISDIRFAEWIEEAENSPGPLD
jgi:hypothetical protein